MMSLKRGKESLNQGKNWTTTYKLVHKGIQVPAVCTKVLLCCGPILSMVEISCSFVSNSTSEITIPKNKAKYL